MLFSEMNWLERILFLKRIKAESGIEKTVTGNPIHITDALSAKVKNLSVALEPMQDLHGQSAPYPAGGGKNKLHNTAESTTSLGVTYTVNKDGSVKAVGTTTGFSVLVLQNPINCDLNVQYRLLSGVTGDAWNGYCVQIVKSDTDTILCSTTNGSVNFTLTEEAEYYARILVRSSATVNHTFYPMILLGTETDTTWSPYSNICPISGRQSVTVWRSGKNLFDESTLFLASSYPNAGSSGYYYTDIIQLTPNTTYSIKGTAKGTSQLTAAEYLNILTFDDNSLQMVNYYSVIQNGSIKAAGTITTTSTGYVRFGIHKGTADTDIQTALNNIKNSADIQLEVGSSATAYEPYKPIQTVEVQLGQTVYGGTVDVTSGEMTVQWQKYVGTVFKTASKMTGGFYSRMEFASYYPANSTSQYYYCCNRAALGKNAYDKWYFSPIEVGSNYVHMYIPENALDYHEGDNVATLLNTTYNASDFEFILPVTPLTVQLVGQSLTTLKGVNNIWSDGGDVSVDYVADTKLFIEQLTEPDADMVR